MTKEFIKSILTFKFISNLSIIVSICAYYMNAYNVFFTFVPLVIVNFIMILIVQIFNYDEIMIGLYGKLYLENKDKDKDTITSKFSIVLVLIHLLPVLWIIYILQSRDIIKIFKPNFMNIFLQSISITILYYYFQSNMKIYGNVNYLVYLILYIGLLLATCYYVYT